MLRQLAVRTATGRAAKRLPFLKFLAIGEIAILAGRHVRHLDPVERRRFVELVRRGRSLDPAERDELRALVAKVDPRAFAGAAADRLSPIPLPRRFTRARY